METDSTGAPLVQPFPLSGSSQVVVGGAAIYRGFAIRETAGATAVVRLYDSPSAASGTLLETISLAANESAREFYPRGLRATYGIYASIVSGSVEGSIRVG